MPAVIATMTPTPTPQGPIMESSTADKKRNKLGYHRTSVACGEYPTSFYLYHPIAV